MSASADGDVENGTASNSFWDCKQYMRTVKRVETANKLCSELCTMIQERAEIERAYSANLKKWSSRWLSFLDTGMEYGSGSMPWRGLCREAENISNVHQTIRNILMDEIQAGVKHWQKEHFHKSALPPQALKEAKQFEQDFEIAQKPWAKRQKKVLQCKKDYYQTCKMVRSLQVQVQNAINDPSGTPEQNQVNLKARKIQDKLKKAEKDVEKALSAYQAALDDLDSKNPAYVEEMTKVFNRTQDYERERLSFFKEVFTNIHHAMDISDKADFGSIYRELAASISQSDVDADLSFWSANHGVDMPAVFPQFEEYSPELQATITTKKRSGTVSLEGSGGITLTGLAMTATSPNHTNNKQPVSNSPTEERRVNTPFDDDAATNNVHVTSQPASSEVSTSATAALPTDEMTDSDYYAQLATYDDGRPGVKVRALYDYTGVEEDEITFKAGDIFEKLEEPDEQGWCKGRKDGRAGLYPANYAEEM